VAGDRHGDSRPQEAIEPAIVHAAHSLDIAAPEVRWVHSTALAADAAACLADADGIWGAPGSPFVSELGAEAAIERARTKGVPFIGTCAGFQHAALEFARNVAGIHEAAHTEYGAEGEPVVWELECSLAGQTLAVRLLDERLRTIYGADEAIERYYCRFGLNPAYRARLEAAGLRVVGEDRDGEARVISVRDHPFFVATLFVPQTSSTRSKPHPLVRAFVEAVARM
jgi:CTP synthase (UTP-ammonia lyase)